MPARIVRAERCGLAGQNCRFIIRNDSCVHISKDVSMQARWIAFRVKANRGHPMRGDFDGNSEAFRTHFCDFVTRMLAACVRILLLFAACRDR